MFLLDNSDMAHTRDGPVRRRVKASKIVGAAVSALLTSALAFADADEASTRVAREAPRLCRGYGAA